MRAAKQYDSACAAAMRTACGMQDDDTFFDRARAATFYALYAPGPAGAVVIDGPFIHVGSVKPCGLAVRRIVNEALKTHPFLVAAIKGDRPKAVALARKLGFDKEARSGEWTLLRRDA